jgi:hypothetical protein
MASKVITLPSGNKVTLKDPKELRQKDRVRIYKSNGDESKSQLERGVDMVDNMIAVLISEWDFDLLPPSVNLEVLGDLSIDDYDVLQAEAESAIPVLFPKLAKDLEGELDPLVLTESSKD